MPAFSKRRRRLAARPPIRRPSVWAWMRWCATRPTSGSGHCAVPNSTPATCRGGVGRPGPGDRQEHQAGRRSGSGESLPETESKGGAEGRVRITLDGMDYWGGLGAPRRRASLTGPIDNRPQVDNLPHIRPQNRVTSLKRKSRTNIPGATMSKVSSPEARTAAESASTFESISIRP